MKTYAGAGLACFKQWYFSYNLSC